MTTGPRLAWFRGAVRPLAECGVSLLDRGLLFGESIYEVLPVVAGRVRLVAQHMQRMRSGAAAIGIEALPADDEVEALAAALCEGEGLDEGILYLQVTGGAGPARAHVAPATDPTFFGFVQAVAMPRADALASPLSVSTAFDPRWARSELKTTMLLPSVLARRHAGAADEVVFFDPDGRLTEGGASSVFIVEGGRVVMPPLTPRVLPSVTRALLDDLAPRASIAVHRETIDRARLVAADEIAVASTTKLVLPVGRVDGQAVAFRTDGVIATLAAQLRERYGLAPTRDA